tara:strand:+ start:46 stop:1878 length:1833 start_codon:yes stop_codon:yes gene_type:complete
MQEISLRKALTAFIKSDLTSDIFKSTADEIRKIYKSKKPFGNLEYYIFNSSWNRDPNLDKSSVRKEKWGYLFRIGSGIASYNLVPISWINTQWVNCKNFLLKDRGHIFEIVCFNYDYMWLISELLSQLETERKEIKKGNNLQQDHTRTRANTILLDVKSYLDSVVAEFKEKKIVAKKQKVSLKDICDNVPVFGQFINYRPIAVEAVKESVWAHTLEILAINNIFNKWIEYQKAFLNFCSYVMDKDGTDDYLKKTLKIDALRNYLNKSPIFMGNVDKDHSILQKGISKYKNKVVEYSDVIPFRLIGISTVSEFKDTKKLWHAVNDWDIYDQLKMIYDNNIDEESALYKIDIYEQICSIKSVWLEYKKEQVKLTNWYTNNTGNNISNLLACGVEEERFGMACIDACYRLITSRCDGRVSPEMVAEVVGEFTIKLLKQLNKVIDDETIFFTRTGMANRFELVILPVYEEMISDLTKPLSKSQTKKHHLDELISTYFNGNPNRSFTIINPVKDKYNNPVIKKVVFDESYEGIDLGQKKQTMGYPITNTFLQILGHNRSENNVNHDIDNLDYWPYMAEENWVLVNHHKDYLLKSGLFEVLSDARKLKEIFCDEYI